MQFSLSTSLSPQNGTTPFKYRHKKALSKWMSFFILFPNHNMYIYIYIFLGSTDIGKKEIKWVLKNSSHQMDDGRMFYLLDLLTLSFIIIFFCSISFFFTVHSLLAGVSDLSQLNRPAFVQIFSFSQKWVTIRWYAEYSFCCPSHVWMDSVEILMINCNSYGICVMKKGTMLKHMIVF